MKTKLRESLKLFVYFFKIGCFTFGGGWSIVAQIQKDYVDRRHELKSEELLDIVSVGRSLPGTMIGNVAYLFGYRQAGVAGGLLSILGICLPPLLILLLLTHFYNAFRDNPWVDKAMAGVRSAVAPIIFAAVTKMQKSAFPHPVCYAFAALSVAAYLLLRMNSALIILLGVVMGLILKMTQKKDKEK